MMIRLQTLRLAAITVAVFVVFHLFVEISPPPQDATSSNASTMTAASSRLAKTAAAVYQGTPWRNTERTVSVETLGETKYARCDVHTVLSEDGSTVINDWLFIEEQPAVNVIVHTLDENKYVVFKQHKYAIPGETLSPVGGFIDTNESPLTAAKREVLEELGLGSRRTLRTIREATKHTKGGGMYDNNGGRTVHDDVRRTLKNTKSFDVEDIVKIIVDSSKPAMYDEYGLMDGFAQTVPNVDYDADWAYLGRYRTSANRGGGFIYSYLLKNAIPLVPGGGTVNYNKAIGDDESQSILYLSEEEVMKGLAGGKFQEVKWTATFALAMLHVKNGMPSCCGIATEWEPPES
jgi:8-oxo-dGTP pyrophosphatase MutT (NUDIX family)